MGAIVNMYVIIKIVSFACVLHYTSKFVVLVECQFVVDHKQDMTVVKSLTFQQMIHSEHIGVVPVVVPSVACGDEYCPTVVSFAVVLGVGHILAACQVDGVERFPTLHTAFGIAAQGMILGVEIIRHKYLAVVGVPLEIACVELHAVKEIPVAARSVNLGDDSLVHLSHGGGYAVALP